MNRFKQHVPAFIDTESSQWIEFKTKKDLLSINAVKQWAKPMDGKPFSHFAISGNYLMAIHDNSFHWWVVGYIENIKDIDCLPIWKGGKYRAKLNDGSHVVLDDGEVVSVCGNKLKLKNGSTAERIG